MYVRRVLAVPLALALALGVSPARAFNGPGCSRSKANGGQKSCVFGFTGLPLQVLADSTGTDAQVRVYVTVSGYPELPPILECSAGADGGAATCSASLPDDTTEADISPHQLVPHLQLQCNFEGSGDWEYGCFSYNEPPP